MSIHVKKTMISSEPRTNSGSETMVREASEIPWSTARPTRTAASDPEQEGQRDHQRGHDRREDERVGDLLVDLPPDRQLAAGCEARRRVAEVAGDEAAEPLRVALRRGPVEPHQLAHLLDLRRRRLLAEDGARRVAGEELGSGEDEDRDDEQRDEPGENAAHHEAHQRMAAAPGGQRDRRNRPFDQPRPFDSVPGVPGGCSRELLDHVSNQKDL